METVFSPPSPARPRWLVIALTAIGGAIAIGLLSAQQPVLAIGAVLLAPLAYIVLLWPDLPTLVTLFLIYTNALVVAIRFHGMPSYAAIVAPALLIIPFVSYIIFHRQKVIINRGLVLLGLYLLVQVVSTLASRNFKISFNALTTFMVEGIGFYVLFINVVRTPTTFRRVVWTILLAGAIIGGLSFYQKVTGTYDNNYGGFAQVTDASFGTGVVTLQGEVTQLRLAGSIGEKNYYAQIMLMLIPLGLFQAWGEKSQPLKILALIATGFIATGAILTYSRGLAIGFVIVLVIMVFLRYIKFSQLVVLLLALTLLLGANPEFNTRLSKTINLNDILGGGPTDTSTIGRLGEMDAAMLVFTDHPIIGVGPAMFKHYYLEYVERSGLQTHTGTREAHNLYLDTAAEMGVLGLACFLSIVAVALYDLNRARQYWKTIHPELAYMATGFFMAITSYLVAGFFLTLAYERYFWVTLALGCALSRLALEHSQAVPLPSASPRLDAPQAART